MSLDEDRHHLGRVIPMTRRGRERPVVAPTLYDHQLEVPVSNMPVMVPALTAKAIVSMLRQARPHLPSQAAVDDAISMLGGEP